jgi:betaine-aldehyde dehydrogenase
MFGCFWTNGQICSSTSRLLVHHSISEKLFAKLAEETKKIFVGDPFVENDPSMGPLVNEAQFKKVLGYIEKGKQEGATVLVGGGRAPQHSAGYFVQPTVFINVTPNMTIWKEEIFGPVLSVSVFAISLQYLFSFFRL